VKSVVEEVEWIAGRYGPEMLWIADDVFTIQHAWIFEYAAEMKRRAIAIPFECITRADRLNARVAGALAELGCFRVWIGSESGSQRVLDAMQRGVKVEQVREAVGLCRAHGIQVGMFLMWGYQGEEREDIEATVAHVKACLPDVFLTTVSYPIKGTPYYEEVAPRLVTIRDWAQTTDREAKIAGRHSRRYYGFADQLLKSEVALARSGDTALLAEIDRARRGLAESYQEVEA
jgi:radical SAM superfamily enzyme YgiQ (UPF0313 family)